MSNIVEISKEIAEKYLKDIKRGNKNYYNHVDDVVKNLKEQIKCEDELCLSIAYLHDLLEESDKITDEIELRNEFNQYDTEFDIEILIKNILNITFDESKYEDENKKRYMKAIYLSRVAIDSSFECLLVKICDRLSNVMDFYNNGSKGYAKTYFKRGEILYGALYLAEERYNECLLKGLYHEDESYCEYVEKKLNYIKNCFNYIEKVRIAIQK